MAYDCIILTDSYGRYATRSAGAYRVATELRANGFTTRVIDYLPHWSQNLFDQAIDKYVGPSTLFVGVSTTFMSGPDQGMTSPHDLCRGIKERYPHIKIVIGGTRSWYDDQRDPVVDYNVIGYADISIVELAKHLRNSEHKVAVVQKNGMNIIHSQIFHPVNNFNHQIFFTEEDHIEPHETLAIEIARGCSFKCKYCGFPLNGKKRNEYIKDWNTLREEFMRNYELFGTTDYTIADDTLNDGMDKVESFTKVISSLPFKISFAAYSRVDLFRNNLEMARLLMEAGMHSCIIGIETMNHETGKSIGKGLHPDKVEDTLRQLKNLWGDRVLIRSGFIAGLPGESLESSRKTHEWLMSSDCPIDSANWRSLYIRNPARSELNPFPSTFTLEPEKYGYHFPRDDNDQWVSPITTYREVSNLIRRWNKELDTKRLIAGFGKIPIMRTMGWSPETKITVGEFQQHVPQWKENGNKQVAAYIEKMLT